MKQIEKEIKKELNATLAYQEDINKLKQGLVFSQTKMMRKKTLPNTHLAKIFTCTVLAGITLLITIIGFNSVIDGEIGLNKYYYQDRFISNKSGHINTDSEIIQKYSENGLTINDIITDNQIYLYEGYYISNQYEYYMLQYINEAVYSDFIKYSRREKPLTFISSDVHIQLLNYLNRKKIDINKVSTWLKVDVSEEIPSYYQKQYLIGVLGVYYFQITDEVKTDTLIDKKIIQYQSVSMMYYDNVYRKIGDSNANKERFLFCSSYEPSDIESDGILNEYFQLSFYYDLYFKIHSIDDIKVIPLIYQNKTVNDSYYEYSRSLNASFRNKIAPVQIINTSEAYYNYHLLIDIRL